MKDGETARANGFSSLILIRLSRPLHIYAVWRKGCFLALDSDIGSDMMPYLELAGAPSLNRFCQERERFVRCSACPTR
jgi:hypothetical protein